MERLFKAALNSVLIGAIVLSSVASWADTKQQQISIADLLAGQGKVTPKDELDGVNQEWELCSGPRKNEDKCKILRSRRKGASENSCSDERVSSMIKGVEDAAKEARQACAGIADGGGDEKTDGSLDGCFEKIKTCAKLRGDVNALDPEETKSEEHTDALMSFANQQATQFLGMQIPDLNKKEDITQEEKDYYTQCPLLGKEQYGTELKANEEKKDKIRDDIIKKKKEIVETMAKANKDMEEYNKKKAERSERARKDKSEYEKEIQRINQDYNKQAADMMKQEADTIKQRNVVDAEYNILEKKRAKLAADLSGISIELTGVCKGKYMEMLAKIPPGQRRVSSAFGAVEARTYKLAYIKRCVNDQWFEIKQQYDKIKSELNSLKSEKENTRKALASINAEKQNMTAMKARQDQAVQQGETDRMTASAQLEQEMIQGAQRNIQQNQQNAQNIQADITNLEKEQAKIERRIIEMGKKPTGKSGLDEAERAVKEMMSKTTAAHKLAETGLDGGCSKWLAESVDPVRRSISSLNEELTGGSSSEGGVNKNKEDGSK